MKITLGYLYPDIMSTYGDRGNLATILRRCEWRNIGTAVSDLRLGDRIRPNDIDLFLIGGGSEYQQQQIATDLYKVKGAAIRDAVAQGAAGLAVGGGYELFGHFCQPGRGAEFPGADLFDAWTIRPDAVSGTAAAGAEPQAVAGAAAKVDADPLAAAAAGRAVGNLLVAWQDSVLVGFENHSGGTYLGPTASPLGHVISGFGNNGDGTEGVRLGNAIGTNLRGPCLPQNPALADFLIGGALNRRYGDAELPPLADDIEHEAHEVAIQRARLAAGL